ncbi:MAG TPA: primosomal protein N' [Ktedonobacterales bacterium]|nr:primosomal protein N' [Ktedonobacterales bacterium]
MRAEVLIARGVREQYGRTPLYAYRVPEYLVATLGLGELVAVPFGERLVAGIVLGLDVSDELQTDANDGESPARREIASRLLPEPILSPVQLALAEWLSDFYAAPLSAAVRLLLPPGLLRSVRPVLLPAGGDERPESTSGGPLPPDDAVVLALLRERGWLAREQVREALGAQRARTVIRGLLARGLATLGMRAPETYLQGRSERRVHLIAAPELLERWRIQARTSLDELTAARAPLALSAGRPAKTRGSTATERRVERLLRQLAVLDVLARTPSDGVSSSWRLEELQRLTRVTPAALAELATAGLVAIDAVDVRRDVLAGQTVQRTAPLPLTSEQSAALRVILAASDDESPSAQSRVFLLHGITGSGKTEVYLQALSATIARGQRGIVLVPEIALTPQAMARFAGRFPGRVALLHSGLSDAERISEWRRIRAGEVDVVLGSRSAVFAPVQRLALIVVDEEHEAAYKEEQRPPTYHARDVAARLGALTGATVVLGSATPSVEAYWRASQGEYTLLELHQRAPAGLSAPDNSGAASTMLAAQLPDVMLVDLRAELRAGNTSILSETLLSALRQTLDRGEQAILFLNRRGMASSVVCRECGFVVRCRSCDVSLTYHAGERALICHYCGRREDAPQACPVCWSASIRYFGIGTERVEMAVKQQFPSARVLRWDRDTAKTRHAHGELLRAFAERRADILVGTQMIAKGLDVPAVTLVGVVSADVALFLPDFRAAERAFQLLTQVAGRAGRGQLPGRVLVQTFNPEHFCIQAAAQHDYATFVTAELSARGRFGYPPFRRFVKYTYEHADRYTAHVEVTRLADRIERILRDLGLPETDLVGPAPAFIERLRGRYRWQLILRSVDPIPVLQTLAAEVEFPRGWSIDIDPASSL